MSRLCPVCGESADQLGVHLVVFHCVSTRYLDHEYTAPCGWQIGVIEEFDSKYPSAVEHFRNCDTCQAIGFLEQL